MYIAKKETITSLMHGSKYDIMEFPGTLQLNTCMTELGLGSSGN
jgi:hypothetical protein